MNPSNQNHLQSCYGSNSNMAISKVWPDPHSTATYKLQLLICEIEQFPVDMLGENRSSRSFSVQIEWRGRRKKSGFLHKGFRRNSTAVQQIQENGVLSWNERFDHDCKLKRKDAYSYKEWIISLEIQEFIENRKGKLPVIAKATVDVARFSQLDKQRRMRIPISCSIKGHAATEAILKVELLLTDIKKRNNSQFLLPRSISLRPLSCTGFSENNIIKSHNRIAAEGRKKTGNSCDRSGDLSATDSSPDHEQDFHYGKITTTNLLLGGQISDNGGEELGMHLPQPSDQAKLQPSLLRIFSRRAKLSSKSVSHPKSPPLLNKACREDGGDDIDNERRHQPSIELAKSGNVPHGFQDDSLFQVGHWQNKRVVSRDGHMELVTDVFLASIDQRSEKAAGGGACSVLATVIAHWLHNNPNTLPLQCQFDELVNEGSSKWRKLCADETHKDKFTDQHFDIETVLEAQVMPLSLVTEKSYVGFFGLDEMTDSLEFLQGAMSFESIWKELMCSNTSEEQIYIASWNDHFFVLKVERDAIYLIDTLGERLYEGCNQAYILRFNKDSAVCRRNGEPNAQTEDSANCSQSEGEEVICQGMDSCKEYIRGFLAALPLRELQQEIKRGLMDRAPLDRRLQIEFHYTTPCTL